MNSPTGGKLLPSRPSSPFAVPSPYSWPPNIGSLTASSRWPLPLPGHQRPDLCGGLPSLTPKPGYMGHGRDCLWAHMPLVEEEEAGAFHLAAEDHHGRSPGQTVKSAPLTPSLLMRPGLRPRTSPSTPPFFRAVTPPLTTLLTRLTPVPSSPLTQPLSPSFLDGLS